MVYSNNVLIRIQTIYSNFFCNQCFFLPWGAKLLSCFWDYKLNYRYMILNSKQLRFKPSKYYKSWLLVPNETPGERILTEPQPEKAKLLCCFRDYKLNSRYMISNSKQLRFKPSIWKYYKAWLLVPNETPGERILTEPEPKKAKLLCCFRIISLITGIWF